MKPNACFTPRAYQTELFEIARKKNSILVLATGSGKTYISILLIKEFADQDPDVGSTCVCPDCPYIEMARDWLPLLIDYT
ncbi:hypothetical protein SK128_004834 [Halocaridina rubra]|uniref:Helicase/UvrB N-terminal domain-containing protein n=1 Tax=Halocaridina rubra TaxID=373956 RepID=A0AAN8WR69_HALRR